jgi:hypothetical protein
MRILQKKCVRYVRKKRKARAKNKKACYLQDLLGKPEAKKTI